MFLLYDLNIFFITLLLFPLGKKNNLKKETSFGDAVVQFLYFVEEKAKIRNQGLSDLTEFT